ncbi:MAG: DNA integrity scanning protein DisA nucleotide-binding domain protein [Candidatus Methanoperedens sp.]
MSLLNNPGKKVQNIVNKIGKGKATESDITNFSEILEKEPSLLPGIVVPLLSILQEFNTKSFKTAIMAVNIAADKDIGIISDSTDVFTCCLQKSLKPVELRNVLEIIFKIYETHPGKMNISAVPVLLVCLRNMNAAVREKAYFPLISIALAHPEFFKGYSKELKLALNGLNVDERIYACKIIQSIADEYPNIVEDTYELLLYLEKNHPSRELRVEAEYAMAKFKIKDLKPPEARKNVTAQENNKTATESGVRLPGKSEDGLEIPEFAGVFETCKKETQNVPGHEYIIQRKENINISDQIEKIIPGTDIGAPVLEAVFNIAVEISREGREGKTVGTSFIIGFSNDVLAKSRQLIHNPVEGIPAIERIITYPGFNNTIKELAQLDGAFVVSGNGMLVAACRFLIADASNVNIPKGLGTRHFSVAAMTTATKAIGLVVSESGGRITIFKNGKIVSSFS